MRDLLAATAALVDVSSVSRDERAIADLVEAQLRAIAGLSVDRIGDNVVARTTLGRGERIVLAGHLDTVPPAAQETSVAADDRLYGLGAADMKSGLAVMLELAAGLVDPPRDVTFVFYAREEIARSESGLLDIEAHMPSLLEGDVAILLEPTSARIEAGCQGVIRAEVVLGGERAHSARPWTGVNAIHRAGSLIARVASFPEREPEIDGVTYHETMQLVRIEGGIAGNVVPDEVRLLISHRFAPDRDAGEAFAALQAFLAPVLDEACDRVELVDAAPSVRPSLDHPVLSTLVEISGHAPVAKVAWTDVAFFSERGVPAANFGPGDPELAHTAGEYVDRAPLDAVYAALSALVLTADSPATAGEGR